MPKQRSFLFCLLVLFPLIASCAGCAESDDDDHKYDDVVDDDAADNDTDDVDDAGSASHTPADPSCAQRFDWLRRFNIYVFGTPDLDYLQKVSGSVIVWSVYHGGVDEAQREYVRELHEAGVKVASNFPTMQSNMEVVHDQDLIFETVCEDIWGHPARALWIEPDPPYLPCHNNLLWQDFLLQRVREHIDGEADAIHLDEVEGIGGHLYLYGLCDSCIAGFNDYLGSRFTDGELNDLFHITDLPSFDYRDYLLDHWAVSIVLDPNPLLRKEFVRFQLTGRKEEIRDLIAEGRDYSGGATAFSANPFYMSANKHPLIPLLDLMVFENAIDPPRRRGKYFGTYQLAEAVNPCAPAVMLPDILDLAVLSDLDWKLFVHWLAEAAAARSGFLLPYRMYTFGGGEYTIAPEKLKPYTDFFVRTGPLTTGARRLADLAVIYDYNGALEDYLDSGYFLPYFGGGKTHNGYLGLTIALQELHILFGVLYEGDGELVGNRINLSDLKRYPAVLVPESSNPRERLEKLLQEYDREGGRVVRLGSLPRQYWASHQNKSLLDRIRESLPEIREPFIRTNAPDHVGTALYQNENALILHLVNYDYSFSAHDFVPKTDLQIDLHLPPGFATEGKALRLLDPEAPEAELPFQIDGDWLSFVMPRLNTYALILFDAETLKTPANWCSPEP